MDEQLTANQDTVLDDQEKETQRFHELRQKEDRTEEENTELKDIEANYGKKVQGKLKEYHRKMKVNEEALERERQDKEDLKQRLDALEKEQKTSPPIKEVSKETEKVGEESYYTDQSLSTMVQAGKISEADAIKHQQDRIEAKAAEKAYSRIKSETTKNRENELRTEDAKSVLRQHPEFDSKHTNYNPDDPLYKTFAELINEGYGVNPEGYTKALKRAKQILNITGKNPDASNELGVFGASPPGDKGDGEEVKMTEDEEEGAYQMWRDLENPATGRQYTRTEAIAKAMNAKKNRTTRRV